MATKNQIDKFITEAGKMAQESMAKTGILASPTIAQAILESGWGLSGLTQVSNNLFGIKGDYDGNCVWYPTTEFINGRYQKMTLKFKSYPSYKESFDDHASLFLRLARYENLRGEKNYKTFCENLQKDGYATAPNYGSALINIIEKYNLTKFDGNFEGIDKYFPKSNYDGGSLVNALVSGGESYGYAYREKIAKRNGIKNYTGTAAENTKLLNLYKAGKLVKP